MLKEYLERQFKAFYNNIKNIAKPTTTEQSTMLANSDILTELQTKIADTSKQYLIKVEDVITGENTYVAIASGRFIALTEAEINQAINP